MRASNRRLTVLSVKAVLEVTGRISECMWAHSAETRGMKSTRTEAVAGFPRSRMPIAAVVLTLLGGLTYSQAAVGFLIIGFVGISAASLPFTVFFLSDMGVIGCVVMMAVRPKRHLAWGISVLLFTVLALDVDGSILVGFYEGSPLLGIIWTAPLILVVIGAILAIIWKPPAEASASATSEVVHS